MSTETEELQYENAREIAREDLRGKFITVVDKTDWEAHYQYLLVTPDAEKRGPNKIPAPFHKMAFCLVVHQPDVAKGEEKMSRTHYLDVDEFLLLADTVLWRPAPPDPAQFKYGVELSKFVGFSSKKREGRQLIITQMANYKDPTKSSFKIEFQWGTANMKDDSKGFAFEGSPKKANLILPESQMQKLMLTGRNHIMSLQTAVNTRYYEELHIRRQSSSKN